MASDTPPDVGLPPNPVKLCNSVAALDVSVTTISVPAELTIALLTSSTAKVLVTDCSASIFQVSFDQSTMSVTSCDEPLKMVPKSAPTSVNFPVAASYVCGLSSEPSSTAFGEFASTSTPSKSKGLDCAMSALPEPSTTLPELIELTCNGLSSTASVSPSRTMYVPVST